MTNIFSSFFHRVKAVAVAIFGSTTWEHTASSVIAYIAPLLETTIQLTAGSPAEAVAAKVIATVQSDLATIGTVIGGATTSDAHGAAVVANSLNSVKNNLSALLDLAEIKNNDKAATITSTVNLIIGEAEAMLQNLPTSAAAAPAPAASAPASS